MYPVKLNGGAHVNSVTEFSDRRVVDLGMHLDNINGIIANGPVHCMEEHDGAYAVWHDAGVKGRVLVHIDAHHDLYGNWFDKNQAGKRLPINRANFIYAAIAEELVRQVIWVVPDETWATPAGQVDIVKELRRMVQVSAATKPRIDIGPDRITGGALGCPVHVCTVQNLPPIDEAVLLDIDVDYLIIPNIGYRGIEVYGNLPWCWPPQLLGRLKARGIHSDLVTIAYSVERGFTPLQWKYLGDELAQRLKFKSQDVEWADCMRRASMAADAGDFAAAEAEYRMAHQLNPASAAPCYHLAHLSAALGRLHEGREFLSQAYTNDPLYRTPHNNAGWWYLGVHRYSQVRSEFERLRSVDSLDPYLGLRRYSQARSAFERWRSLDSQDPYACLGLGLVAIQEKDWARAEVWLRRSLDLEDCCIDTHRALARVLAKRKDYSGAIAAYERSLELASSGRRTVWGDIGRAGVNAKLATLYAARGAWTDAIAYYRMARMDRVRTWVGLAGAYTRTGRVREALMALRKVGECIPKELMWRGKRLLRACRWWALAFQRDRRSEKIVDAGRPQIWI
jgi:tetratricopeptide (TPR) repeat protein